MKKKSYIIAILLLASYVWAFEPIKPIPQNVVFNQKQAQLGKLLFMDTALSIDNTISCLSCHSFDAAGADPRKVSIGVAGQEGGINSPPVFNAVFNFKQFWNGRADSLLDQAQGPIHNPVEMGMDSQKVEKRLNANAFYRKEFELAFGKKKIYFSDVIASIVEFEKALITPNSKFDRFLRKEVELTKEERQGYTFFKTLGCITCHNGVNLGGNSYQKIGVIYEYPHKDGTDDLYKLTRVKFDKNIFKVPTLRNIVLSAPYFHDGSAKTIKEAIKTMAYHNLGFDLKEKEINAIAKFFHTLTGEKPKILK